jgi:hypothetical protein
MYVGELLAVVVVKERARFLFEIFSTEIGW